MSLPLGYDLDAALKRADVSIKTLQELRTANIENVPENLSDHQLLLFYLSCNKSITDASKTLKKYYSSKLVALEHFTSRDPRSPHIQQCLKNQIYFYLPVTPNGNAVIYHRLANTKPSNYVFDEAIKTYFMTIDSCLHTQGPQKSVIFLFDMKNVNLGHLTRIRISAIKKFFHYVQDCIPCVLHEIHILNTVGFFDKVLALIKPFMKADILEKLYLHPTTTDYEKILKDVIPLSCLPSDFGGELGTLQEMHDQHCEEFYKLQTYFAEEEKQWNTKGKKIENIQNSFTKLEID